MSSIVLDAEIYTAKLSSRSPNIKSNKLMKHLLRNNKNVFIAILVFFILVIVIFTILYEKLPLLINYSVLGQESFYFGLITNMYSSAIDFLVFTAIFYTLMEINKKQDRIRRYKENIDDYRFLFSKDVAFKNYANIRRLQELEIFSIDISKCTLEGTKPKYLKLIDSQAMGACFNDTNLERSNFQNTSFKGANAERASFSNSKINSCDFKYLKLLNGKMKACEISSTDFSRSTLTGTDFKASKFTDCKFDSAILDDCDFTRADLRGASGLTAEQLLKCKNMEYVILSEPLKTEFLKKITPEQREKFKIPS